jgi:hypothetical protein
MKLLLKKILPLIFLVFAINIMNAKSRSGQTTRPTTQPPVAPAQIAPKPVAIPQQPITQPQSYAQALAFIKTQMPTEKVIVNNAFVPDFITFVKALDLSDVETKALLQAGMNLHVTWTDNDTTNKKILLSLKNSIQNIAPTKSITPTLPKPIEQPKQPIPTKNQSLGDLQGKVTKLKGYDIYVGAGTTRAGEPIFFALEKLDDERMEVWRHYTRALFSVYRTRAMRRLEMLNDNCDKTIFPEVPQGIGPLDYNDPYSKKLMAQMCPNKEKLSPLFSEERGISIGIVGFDQMLGRYRRDKNNVIYIAYASSQPITGPFKPKKNIDLDSFTLEELEIAYSDLIICMAVDMMQNLKLPISIEDRGIFKNPFYEIEGTYKYIALMLHGWAGTVGKQIFNKEYMTVFPTEAAAKQLHRETKKGDLYLGTDKQPFPYDRYYKNDTEQQTIKDKFPPIRQELIGDAPTKSLGGFLEHLHVFDLNALSKYYTNK